MYIEQLYTKCLAEAAYYVESDGEAIIIDPMREVQPYLDKARSRNASIKYILETHFHADFVSGHVDLARKTGAQIVYGPTATTVFDAMIATDGQVLKLGKISIEVMHTPGHTMESTTYLLRDENGNPHCIFSGDTLFIGDVGRPDLAVKGDLSKEDLAGLLFDSLRNKIMTLPDEVVVYPAHGAGSACGKNLSSETFDTLGNQKKVNYALQQMTKAEFVKEVTDGIMPAPQYFPKNAVLNKVGYDPIEEIIQRSNKGLSLSEFKELKEAGNLILDTRHQKEYLLGAVPDSLFIGLNGSFASWVGALILDLECPILLITDHGKEEEAIIRLARVGYSGVIGFLEGGFESWKSAGLESQVIESIDAESFANRMLKEQKVIIDVRNPSEFEAEHVDNAKNYPLDFFQITDENLDSENNYFVHCKGGYRSVIACSLLISRGIKNVIDVKGGMNAIAKTNAPITKFVCPSTIA